MKRWKTMLRAARRQLAKLNLGKARRKLAKRKATRKAKSKERKQLTRERETVRGQLDELYERLEDEPDNDRLAERIAAKELLEEELTRGIRRTRRRIGSLTAEIVDNFKPKVRRRKRKKKKLGRRIRKAKRKLEQLQASPKWPASGRFTELFYHDPGPHVHAASDDRDFLIRIGKVGQEEYGLRIGEFPPFDPVECVHVDPGSWHYRHSGNPLVSRSCSNRGDGLAFDANDADNGSDREQAFYAEIRRRYA